jgi:hypothetical protein
MKKRIIVMGLMILFLLFGALPQQVLAADNDSGLRIDAISDSNTVVIGDVTYKVADNANLYGEGRITAFSLSSFNVGDRVEFIIDNNGEIVDMWVVSE